MRAWLVTVLASIPAVAGAEGFESRGPDGLTIEADGWTAYVRDGNLRAPLVDAATDGAEAAGPAVTIHLSTGMCGPGGDLTFTTDQLRARLANVRGYHAHKRGLYQAAMVDFAHAVELDPTFRTAATNFASAQVLVGRRRAAIVTLGSWLRMDRVGTYIKIATDAELSPLLAEPELAPVPDQIDPVGDPLTMDAALAVGSGLVARANRSTTTTNDSISLFDTTTGALVATLRLDTDDAVATARQILFGLGFTPVALVEGRVLSNPISDDYLLRVELGDVGLVQRNGPVRAFRHDTQLGEGTYAGHFHGASYIPAGNLVFIESSTSCADADEEHEQTIVLAHP